MPRSASLCALIGLLLAPACFFSIADVKPRADAVPGASGGAAGSSIAGASDSGAGGAWDLGAVDPPIELVGGQSRPWDLAQDVDDLYWTAADGVYRCAKTGEAAWLKKVTDGSNLFHLVVDDGWVYFADGSNSRIAKVEKAGGLAQTVVSAEGPFALSSDGEALFYGSASGGVFRVNKDGSGVRQLYHGVATRKDAIWELALDGPSVIFGSSEERGVFVVAKDGSSEARLLAKATRDVFGVVAQAGTVFFREGNAASGLLVSVAVQSAERMDLLDDEAGPAGLAFADGRVFFARDVSGAAQIRELQLGAAQLSSLASERQSALAVQVDDAAVYWTEPESGKVMKLLR